MPDVYYIEKRRNWKNNFHLLTVSIKYFQIGASELLDNFIISVWRTENFLEAFEKIPQHNNE